MYQIILYELIIRNIFFIKFIAHIIPSVHLLLLVFRFKHIIYDTIKFISLDVIVHINS